MVLTRQVQSIVLCCTLALSTFAQDATRTAPATPATAPTPAEFQQLVAPIALYPDALVAQILAASTYPTQIVEAQRWLQQNPGLTGDTLVSALDKQPWDPSVKALAQFPSVLNNMSKNLSWTSGLGDAYFNDPKSVMTAIQAMRRQAEAAGTLASNQQQTVKNENQTVVIEPTNPEVVYVPEYSPAAVYGEPIAAYPGYSGWDVAAASALSFGVGTAVGAAIGSGWGWNSWGTNWHGGNVTYNRNTYVSNSNTFANRNANFNQFNRANVNANAANRNMTNRSLQQNRGQVNNFAGQSNRMANSANLNAAGNRAQQFNRDHPDFSANRGFGEGDRSFTGSHTGAFGGFSQGGAARMDSARGMSSFGGFHGGGGFGGGGFRGGGGGFRGGGRR